MTRSLLQRYISLDYRENQNRPELLGSLDQMSKFVRRCDPDRGPKLEWRGRFLLI